MITSNQPNKKIILGQPVKNKCIAEKKSEIIRELLEKEKYSDALEFAKNNIGIINTHQSSFFTGNMPHSLQYTILHLANLQNGFIQHDDIELSKIFHELFLSPPTYKQVEQLASINNIKVIKNSMYAKYNGHIYNKNIDITFANGDKFSGDILNGLYYKGKLTHANGDTTDGQFKNGLLLTGTEKYTGIDGSTNETQWENGERHGLSKRTYPNGSMHKTKWEKGRGVKEKRIHQDGSSYEGKLFSNYLISIDEKYLSNFMRTMFKIRVGQLDGNSNDAPSIFFKNIFKHIKLSKDDKNFNNFIKIAKFRVNEIYINILYSNMLINKLNTLIIGIPLVFNPDLNGHVVILECILINNNIVKLSIYNSGSGLRYHERQILRFGKEKFQTRKNFIFDKTEFVEKIVPLINNKTSVKDFYDTLTTLHKRKSKHIFADRTIWQKKQVGGSCSIEAYMAYFKNLGGEIVYNKFQLLMLDILKNKYSICSTNLEKKELERRYKKIEEKINNL